MARGGDKRRQGGSHMSRDVQVSKKLSWLLRHGAEKEGLKLGKGGYANLADVLGSRTIKSIGAPTLDEIQTLVAENDKQRYSLIHISQLSDTNAQANPAAAAAIKDPDVHNYLIRANQGHTLKVEEAGLLTPLTLAADNLPDIVVHGTRHDAWPLIIASGGLRKMGRNHVHFATGVPKTLQSVAPGAPEENVLADAEADATAESQPASVVSGMRNSSTVLIFINLRLALEKGLKFWTSDNGVVLTEGDERGLVGLELFSKVEQKGGKIIVQNGEVVAELDPRMTKNRRKP